ncbi:MAG: tetratricopeptide repeat protein, partial [Acidobacteriota bacterium]|nr:tetratricopeptide repeat protein [Acidobacteriota bacterium]
MTLELIVRVSLLLATAIGSLYLLRNASAAMRHLVGTLALVAAIVLPLAATTLPRWDLPLLDPSDEPVITQPADVSTDAALMANNKRREKKAGDLRATNDHPKSVEKAANIVGVEEGQRTASPLITPARFLVGLSALWILGFLAVISRLGLGWYRMNQLAVDAVPVIADDPVFELLQDCCDRMQIRSAPRLMFSDALQVPVLWGLWSPLLILPRVARQWSVDRQRVVLLHELAHMRRRDGLYLLLGRVSAALWWFQPAVWWVETRARQDCEKACDDLVVRSGERPSEYARHLMEIARELPTARSVPAEALSMMGSGNFERRLTSILTRDTRRGIRPAMLLATFALFAVAITTLAVANPVPRDSKGTQADYMLAHDRHDHDDDHDREDRKGERLFDQASDRHNDEEWSQAADLFDQAAAAGYRPGTSLYNAACGHARMGDAAASIDRIERAMENGFDGYKYLFEDSDLDPIRSDGQFQSLLGRVKEDNRNDRYTDAREAYEDLTKENSDEADAWYDVGSNLLSMREYETAVDALERANRLEGGSSNALYNLACAYSLQNNTRSALDTLEQAVLQGFDSEERFANDSDLDNIRDAAGFVEVKELHDTLSLNKYREGSWGGSEYSTRRWEPAIADMQEMIKLRPDAGRAWSNLGWALHHSSRHAEARDAFMKQLDLGFNPSLATYNVACTYAMEGNNDSAIEWLQKSIDDDGVSVHQMIQDEDLEGLHDDDRWEGLLEEAADGQPYEVHRGVLQ